MPAKETQVNLLGEQDLEHKPLGRMLLWATTYGRYIMITTEIVVLLAFISRFSLDRKLTDLNEEISQKQTIIEANAEFEKEVRTIQQQLAKVKTITSEQPKPVEILKIVQQLLPPDVYLQSFNLTGYKLFLDVTAGTTTGFSQFIGNITSRKELSGVTIGEVKRQPLTGIQFQLTAIVGTPKPTAKPTKTPSG